MNQILRQALNSLKLSLKANLFFITFGIESSKVYSGEVNGAKTSRKIDQETMIISVAHLWVDTEVPNRKCEAKNPCSFLFALL